MEYDSEAAVDGATTEETTEVKTEATELAGEYNPDEDERKLFVGGLKGQTSAKEMQTYFEKFGVVERATLKTDNFTGESRGFGFILFEDKASIEAVMAEESHTLNGKVIGLRQAKTRSKPDPILKVFIGGLDASVTEEILTAHFEPFGTAELILPLDKETNERTNFAFVKYETEEAVEACLAANNEAGKQTIGDKEYDVNKSKPKYGGRGGGGRGRGRGRGGYGGGWGGGYGGYDDYYGGYGGYGYGPPGWGYGGPRGGFGKAPRGRGRGRGGFAPY